MSAPPDMQIIPGRPDRPACVFVHGLGMSRVMWTDPANAPMLGGLWSMREVLQGYTEFRTLFHDMAALGHTVAAWSQHRPVGPADEAVDELFAVIEALSGHPHEGLILVGHSRGGIVARKAAETGALLNKPLRALVTVCSPHGGTELARLAGEVSRVTTYINRYLPGNAKVIKRALDFMESEGVRELLPGSAFLSTLKDRIPDGLYCLSIGGTSPAMINLPAVGPLPAMLARVIPEELRIPEIEMYRGDGLVTGESARLPYAAEHINFPLHHVAAAVDPAVRSAVVERLARYCA